MARTKMKPLASPPKLMLFVEGEAYRVRIARDDLTLASVAEDPVTITRSSDGMARCSCRSARPCPHVEALQAVGLI